ncbi:MAG: cytochrome c [Acidobacteriaceae bacterium]
MTFQAKHLVPALLMVGAIGAAGISPRPGYTQSTPPSGSQPQVKQYKSPKAVQSEDEGQRVFAQNCSRCHNAPEGFSPRISGSIVRHMRVRANLSEHDEQALLHFLNP